MKRIPLYDETVTVSCTISPEEIPERLVTLERMRTDLDRLERTEHGLLLHFPADRPDIESALRQFAVDEKRCCQFWGFDVLTDPTLALSWDGPPTATDLIDQLESFFTGDEPASILTALL